jgi:hypothetical protein
MVSLPIQSPNLNIQNLVYPSTLPNVVYKKSIIPLIEYVMEQNLVGFPNLMYPHVGSYTPYFGYSYGGIGSVPTMWPPMFDPLINPTTSSTPILKFAQTGIITNRNNPLDEDEDYSKEKHNTKMPQIIPIKKMYHDQKGRSSSIGNVVKPLTCGQIVLINNNDGGPFSKGGNRPLRGGGNGLQEVVVIVLQEVVIADTWESKIQNHRYSTSMPWIGPTWNLWYPFLVSCPTPYGTSSKSLPYPIYIVRTDVATPL